MAVTKKVLRSGNGVDKPNKGDEVVIDYTGYLYDTDAASNNYMGDELALLNPSWHLDPANLIAYLRFDSSRNRGEFRTQIGVGKVIRGKLTFTACPWHELSSHLVCQETCCENAIYLPAQILCE